MVSKFDNKIVPFAEHYDDDEKVHQPDNQKLQPKERFRDSRKRWKDQFQITINEVDPDDWDDWIDEELFEQFEPIQKNKRKR